MAGIGIPSAIGIDQRLFNILRKICQQVGIRRISFQEGLHIPYLIRFYELFINIHIRNGHQIRQISRGNHQA